MPMSIELPCGDGTLAFRLPEANLAGIFAPQPIAGCTDPQAEVVRALAQPLDTPRLSHLVQPHERVVILVDDHTRTTPAAQILPALVDHLHAAGIPDHHISILITHGTHRLSTPEEVRCKIGEDACGRFEVIQHRCEDEPSQVYVGLTSRGTPVWVNRRVVEADRRIGIGHIGPSPYAGYSGGYKLIIPGVAALDTIDANHSLVPLGFGQPGNVELPCRQDIDEAAGLVGLDLVLDVVLSQDEQIIRAFAGAPEGVYRAGVAFARPVYEVPCDGPFDIAVTSGYPYDMDLYQATRAIEYADAAVRTGGSIVLVAPCSDGIGGADFHRLLADPAKKADDFLRDMVRRSHRVTFSVLGYALARIKAAKRLYIVTDGVPPDELQIMGFQHLASLQEGVDTLLGEYGPQAQVAVFPMGSATIPAVPPKAL